MMKNFKYIINFILVILIGISVFIKPAEVSAKTAETLGDLRKAYEAVLAEKKKYDSQSQQAKNDIAKKEAEKDKAQRDLTKAEADEEEAQRNIEESNQKIEENKKESESVLLYMQQMQSKNAYVEYITGSSNMTELVTRMEAVKQVTDYIQITLDNLEKEIDKNVQLKEELIQKQKELSDQITSYQNTISKLYDDVEELNESSLSLDQKLSSTKEDYEAQKRICKQVVGSDADEVVISTCSLLPVNGGWLRPLNSGIVTSPMGYRTHPTTGQKYKFHDAIDIGVSEGTPVYAAAAGQVKAMISRSSCGGNKLYINVNVNGEEYTTYYYHLLRFNVSVGDMVDQNTIIGYVGGYSTSTSHGGYDSCTTGAHLHYGVQTGYYNTRTGIVRSNVIVPPGFKNSAGYRFTSRYN